jgi:glucosamine--fructose-6-phosphate aminotransferase (isomerizing)
MNLENNPYVGDILSQADSLKNALRRFDPAPLQPLAARLRAGGFGRIILTGMGASFYAAYPIWLRLAQAGLPAFWVDTAELLHYARPLITDDSLVWILSQSGRSAEIVALLDSLKGTPAALLATVNDLESPLALSAKAHLIPIHAEPELTVSTRTYLNTLAAAQLAALVFIGEDVQQGWETLQSAAEAIAAYLADWKIHLETIGALVPPPRTLALLGRGVSLASAYTGALILGEASKVGAIALQAGQFRHGPMELAGENLTALLFAGAAQTRQLLERLHADLIQYGARAVWIAPDDADQPKPRLPMPEAAGIALPLAEIIPIQLLTIHLALQNGIEPGAFFHSGKVTLSE